MLSIEDLEIFGRLTALVSKLGSINFDWNLKKQKLTIARNKVRAFLIGIIYGFYWLHEIWALREEFTRTNKRYEAITVVMIWALGFTWCFFASVNMFFKDKEMVWFFNQLLLLNARWKCKFKN